MDHKIDSFIQALSLDISLGTWGGATLAVQSLGLKLPLIWWVTLPLATWVVYTLDHLLDAQKLRDKALLFRHRFHWQFRKWLWTVVAIVTVGLFCITGFMAMPLFKFGSLLAFLAILYFCFFSKTVAKEWGVSVIYTIGIWGYPLWQAPKILANAWVCLGLFWGVVMANLVVHSYFDFESDRLQGSVSLAQTLGQNRLRIRFFVGVFIWILGWIGWGFVFGLGAKQGVLLGMMGVTVVLVFFRSFFGRNNRYWGIAEGVFYLPLILFKR